MNKEIRLDFDGVLIQTAELWSKLYAEKYPDKTVPRLIDITSWDLTNHFDFTKKQMYEMFDETRMNKSFKYGSPCDNNFHIWVAKMRDLGCNIKVLTANPESCKPFIKYFMGKYGLGDLEIICVATSQEKFNTTWDIIIDDSPSMYEILPMGRVQLLYNAPWNGDTPERENVIRVYNFKDVYEKVKAFRGREELSDYELEW